MLALPEVQLGLIPGRGRDAAPAAPDRAAHALDMILTGRNVRAKKALQMGLVDELVHPAILRDVAVQRARELGRGEQKRSVGRKQLTLADLALEENPAGRAVVFRQAREKVREEDARALSRAARRRIDAVAAGYSIGREGGLSRGRRASSARWR